MHALNPADFVGNYSIPIISLIIFFKNYMNFYAS